MSVLDAGVLVLMAVGIVVYVGEPFFRREPTHDLLDEQGQQVEQLVLQKETVYTAIADLDFDYHTGKVEQQDYAALRQDLEREAIAILRQLDAVDPLAVLDNELESQIAALRQGALGYDAMTLGICRGCGVPLHGDEKFCAFCGQPLTKRGGEDIL